MDSMESQALDNQETHNPFSSLKFINYDFNKKKKNKPQHFYTLLPFLFLTGEHNFWKQLDQSIKIHMVHKKTAIVLPEVKAKYLINSWDVWPDAFC